MRTISLINQKEASKVLGCSESTLKNLRASQKLKLGVHYRKPNSRKVEYYKELLEHYQTYGSTPIHDKFCRQFIDSYNSQGIRLVRG